MRAELVSDYHQWPGVLYTASAWLNGPKTIKRPRYFFDQNNPDTAEVTLTFVPPSILITDRSVTDLIKELEEQVASEQQVIRVKMAAKGRSFMGVKRICEVNPYDRPTSKEPAIELNPQLSASDPEALKKGKERLKYFRQAYREALKKLKAGVDAIFPYGTFWYRRLLNVPCEPAYTMQL